MALDAYAPACRKHMTAAEREEDDTNPLWSDEGQVRWLLARRPEGGELLTTAAIAEQLKLQPGTVSRALERLRARGAVVAGSEGERDAWADPVLFERWRERVHREDARVRAELEVVRARVEKRNDALGSIASRLREVVAGRDVGVSLVGGTPQLSEVPAEHALVLSVDDPEVAEWLVDRLAGKPE
ncbi:hypothetical protein GCM10022243_19850 [Saccharothrix violaceirubra]